MEHPDESPYDGNEEVIISVINPAQEYEPEKLVELQQVEDAIDQALLHLSSKHKIIYLTYSFHEHKAGIYLSS